MQKDITKIDLFFNEGELIEHKNKFYEVQELIGMGTFSQVYQCNLHVKKEQQTLKTKNTQNNNEINQEDLQDLNIKYALKIIKNPQYKQRAQKEIEILQKLKKQPNIVQIIDHFQFEDFQIIVLEHMETSLSDILQFMKYQGVLFVQISKWAQQILKALQILQQNQIIHADIKPSNILFKNDIAYISDFGSAFYESENQDTYQNYFQSRYYRCLEVIFNEKNSFKYNIDMWSLGCVLAEAYLGFPLFNKCQNNEELVQKIIKFCLLQNKNDKIDEKIQSLLYIFKNSSQFDKYFDKTDDKTIHFQKYNFTQASESQQYNISNYEKLQDYIIASPVRQTQNYEELLQQYTLFENFIQQMLNIDYKQRITPQKALNHTFLKVYE